MGLLMSECISHGNFYTDRPREMSSKVPVPVVREIIPVKKTTPRDPRFDSLCGTFNEKVFNFLD